MSFLFRKKEKELTNFERRQSLAQKVELEERRRAASNGVEYEDKPDATQFIGASIGQVVSGQAKKPSMINSSAARKGTSKRNDLPPPPPLFTEMRTPADTEYIEFTIIPLLLRANVAYEEAVTYGESLGAYSDAEVKVLMLNPDNFIQDCKNCGIKLPINFERSIAGDMIWQKKTDSRKSFVYYKPTEDVEDAQTSGRPASRSHSSSSFALPPTISEARSVDANRFKVKSKSAREDAITDELEDLEDELEDLMREEMAQKRRASGRG